MRKIAAMLPLATLPDGWEVGKLGTRHLETFNADNLFEKIDGRAESFVDYKVKGMAYTYYHPTGDDSNEVQLYIFEMGDTLKALGKYGTEKPDGSQQVVEAHHASGQPPGRPPALDLKLEFVWYEVVFAFFEASYAGGTAGAVMAVTDREKRRGRGVQPRPRRGWLISSPVSPSSTSPRSPAGCRGSRS